MGQRRATFRIAARRPPRARPPPVRSAAPTVRARRSTPASGAKRRLEQQLAYAFEHQRIDSALGVGRQHALCGRKRAAQSVVRARRVGPPRRGDAPGGELPQKAPALDVRVDGRRGPKRLDRASGLDHEPIDGPAPAGGPGPARAGPFTASVSGVPRGHRVVREDRSGSRLALGWPYGYGSRPDL